MNLDAKKLSGLTGPQVLQLVIDTVAQEREACAAIADTMAAKYSNRDVEEEWLRDLAHSIAAQIRQRGKA